MGNKTGFGLRAAAAAVLAALAGSSTYSPNVYLGRPLPSTPREPRYRPSKAAQRQGDRERAAELRELRRQTTVVDDPLGINDTRPDHYLHSAARQRRRARREAARG